MPREVKEMPAIGVVIAEIERDELAVKRGASVFQIGFTPKRSSGLAMIDSHP